MMEFTIYDEKESESPVVWRKIEIYLTVQRKNSGKWTKPESVWRFKNMIQHTSLNSAVMEIATNSNWEESWCTNFNKIVNNYGAVMTRSKYRSLQREIGCPMGALLVSLPSVPKRHSGSSEVGSQAGRSCGRHSERSDHGRRRSWRRRWRRRDRRNRTGFVVKRWGRRAAGYHHERPLQCLPQQEEPSQRADLLPSIEIPDPTPPLAPQPLISPPTSATATFNTSQSLLPNMTPAHVHEPSPFGMNSLQKVLQADEPMGMQPLSAGKCAPIAHQMGMFRMPEPTWQQWNGSPEISAKKTAPQTTHFIGKNFNNNNITGETSSRGHQQFIDVYNNIPGTVTSPGSSTKNLMGEARVSNQSDRTERQEAHIDVEATDDEVNTGWSMENTRGSVVSDAQEEMDVDVEGVENDPSMTVPDEWCDACRKRLAPTTEIMSLSRRYRVAKWIGSLLGFMGLVNLDDAQRAPIPMLEMHPVSGAGTSSPRPPPDHRGMFS